jgi:TM2 domain-containing membrane protein YozV
MGKKTAAILSLLIVGLGQFYAGRFWRAAAWFFGSIILLAILGLTTGIGGLIVAPILWIGSAWDAYRIAGD